VLQMQVYTPPPPLEDRRPDVPAAISAVLRRALAKDPAQRFSRIAEFGESLLSALQWSPPASDRPAPLDDANSSTLIMPPPIGSPRVESTRPQPVRPPGLAAAGAVIVLLVLGFGLGLLFFRGDSIPRPTATPRAAQPPAASTSAPSLAGAPPV